MNNKERKDVWNTAYNNGMKQSTSNPYKQIDNNGNSVTHVGSNRTVVNGKTVNGSTNGKNAIKGLFD